MRALQLEVCCSLSVCPSAASFWVFFSSFLLQRVYLQLFVLMFLSRRVLAVFINVKSDGEALRLHFKANISQRRQILYLFPGLLTSLFEGELVVFLKKIALGIEGAH